MERDKVGEREWRGKRLGTLSSITASYIEMATASCFFFFFFFCRLRSHQDQGEVAVWILKHMDLLIFVVTEPETAFEHAYDRGRLRSLNFPVRDVSYYAIIMRTTDAEF